MLLLFSKDELLRALVPQDDADENNAILELRAGMTCNYNNMTYYMASQIACCDWLPKRARWSRLARLGLPAVSRKQNFTKSHIINPLLTKFVDGH